MRTMTDAGAATCRQAVNEIESQAIDERAASREMTSADGNQQRSSQVEQISRTRRNAKLGRKAVLIDKINDKLLRMTEEDLKLIMTYASFRLVLKTLRRAARAANRAQPKEA